MDSIYKVGNTESIDSPAILVYPELIIKNILKATGIAGGPGLLRPHVKTHKMVEVSKFLLEAGIDKFKCATIAEAEMLVMAGAKDILLAYQPTAVKATRLAKLAQANPEVMFGYLVDNKESALTLHQLLFAANIKPWIDVNVGMNRTGIKPAAAAELYRYMLNDLEIKPAGLHGYDGHIHDTDTNTRFAKAEAIYLSMTALAHELENEYHHLPQLVLGGTPCFPYYASQPGIQSSPGTFVFWDSGYSKMFPDMDFVVSAVLLTRVISVIDEQTICLDLGHKSVAAESPLPRVVFPDHPEASVIGQSEEHLVVKIPDSTIINVGDEWFGIPVHICPTVALYDSVQVINEGFATESWKVIARDRAITV
ncbi:MAG: D-TA family PLP-dependent enzyme [Chitinophagaceae bacterium]|nr:MAG: D-TA family PLP-dependent enzyme [Chitinophagaceae bacterium]